MIFLKTSIVFFLFILSCKTSFEQKRGITKHHADSHISASIARGKVVYAAHCLACHQVDGSGVPNLNPPLIRTTWVKGSKGILVQQILKGSHGKVVIDGDHFNNTMPPLPSLTDQEIADVLTYIRNSFKNKYSAVLLTDVKAERTRASK